MKYLRNYTVKVVKDGDEIEIPLRLSIRSQLALKKKYGKDLGSLMSEAITDPEKGLAILEEALKAIPSPVSSADELYDLLVDGGMAGYEEFAELYFRVAHESGIISAKQLETMLKRLSGAVDEAIEEDSKN